VSISNTTAIKTAFSHKLIPVHIAADIEKLIDHFDWQLQLRAHSLQNTVRKFPRATIKFWGVYWLPLSALSMLDFVALKILARDEQQKTDFVIFSISISLL